MIKAKKTLENIEPYFTPKYPQICTLKLDSNENPYGPSSAVIEALKELSPIQVGRYPHYGALVDKIAQKYSLKDTEILVSNGADEALSVIINTYLDKDEELLCFMPTFSMPALYACASGGIFRGIDYYTKWVFDSDKLISEADEKTKLIYITSPNNPTGEMASIEDIEKILKKFPYIGVILDITYINFSNRTAAYQDLISRYDNLFIVKSFSKDYSLAGLRLGIILSAQKNIETLKKVISPYSVNQAAVIAGLAALSDNEYFSSVKEKIVQSRDLLFAGLIEKGFKPYRSEGNFVLCDFGRYCEFVYKKLDSAGIKARCFNSPDTLKSCLRITVPRLEDVNLFFDAIKKKNLLVFDLDGVVFDVSNSYRLAIKETFKYFSGKELPDNEIQKAKEKGGLNCDWDLTKYLLEKHGFDTAYEEIKEVFQNMFFNPDLEGSKGLIDNEKLLISKEIFENLSDRYDFAVFTGRPRDEAVYSLEKYDILKYFTKIISQDDIDKDKRKPHPEGLNQIKHSTYYDKIFYFGDTIDDIYSGTGSSTETFGVVAPENNNGDILLEAGAKAIIEDISTIEEFLEAEEKSYAN